ncbi:DMT family transporter [Naasia lichenicola]|uniref:QacE family quaternary ammonium compound efflux SMR transporter n=1 Tax=Naasia lichenicola TaxID=2565933 RepID=A0A4S4FHK1_9MICO|nr:SMR family transporter [Naasia lichenicola]THG29803.1 QacE family quaternary ammonium compound efflux SMR transporter [Naasia lichenicola]
MGWVFLISAILIEVGASLALQAAVNGRKPLYAVTVLGYVAAFSLLSLALGHGMPLGVSYGIWAATGVALTAVLARIIFKQRFTWVMSLGIALIIGGVLLIELGSGH